MNTALRLIAFATIFLGFASAKPADVKREKSDLRIVVDVGHVEGGGALSARGVNEYDFNLRLAREIVDDLKAAGFEKAELLVTQKGNRRGLMSRALYANRRKADLFLSIHHDSVPDRMLKKWTFEGKERFYCDDYFGHSIFVSRNNAKVDESLKFAKMLGAQMKERGLQFTGHYIEKKMGNRRREWADRDLGVYYFDDLVVLMYTSVPAVLLEAGSIINREEEAALNTEERRKLIRAAVVKAVGTYFAEK